jgi:uncharacterized BrkB/YihY/UPF0761 family membrane protein
MGDPPLDLHQGVTVHAERPTVNENAVVDEERSPGFGTGMMHVLALYAVLSLLSFINQTLYFDFNPCLSYGSSCGSGSSMGFYEYMTIVPLVLAGLIFISGFFLLLTEKRGPYGGGAMVGSLLSIVLFWMVTLAASFGLSDLF